MKIPIELLADDVNEHRIFGLGKFIHALGPERNGKTDQQDRFDQDDGKFQVRRNAALHPFVISHRMAALAETYQNKNEKADQPTNSAPMNQWQNSRM